jgi:hypothetical protein
MNVFLLDSNFETSAKYHVDKHIVKMPLEAAQLLCTALWVDKYLGFVPRALDKYDREKLKQIDKENRDFAYLPSYENHPWGIWARESLDNWIWLWNYADTLGDEYTYRYGKVHKSTQVIRSLPEPVNMEERGLRPMPQCMPDDVKIEDKFPVQAYRNYYKQYKNHLFGWKNREVPSWLNA